jgi:hypothetical protein
MNSGQSAGISPYDCQAVIINIFIIDNVLSVIWNARTRPRFKSGDASPHTKTAHGMRLLNRIYRQQIVDVWVISSQIILRYS